MYDDLDENLLTREALLNAGASLHRGEDEAVYALLPPTGERRGHYLLRIAGDAATVVGATGPGVDPSRMLDGHLDGSLQAKADRFHAWLAEREAEVSPTIADPMRAAGYEVHHTGGGCLAWMRTLDKDGETYLLITSDADIAGDPDAVEWVVGRYDGDSWFDLEECFTLPDAISVAARLPAAHGDLLRDSYPTLEAALAANPPADPPA